MVLTAKATAKLLFMLTLCAYRIIADSQSHWINVTSNGFNSDELTNAGGITISVPVNDYITFHWNNNGAKVWWIVNDGQTDGNPHNCSRFTEDNQTPITPSCNSGDVTKSKCNTNQTIQSATDYWFHVVIENACRGNELHVKGLYTNLENATIGKPTEDPKTGSNDASGSSTGDSNGTGKVPPKEINGTDGTDDNEKTKRNKGVLTAGIVLIILAAAGSALVLLYTRRKLKETKGPRIPSDVSSFSQSVALTNTGTGRPLPSKVGLPPLPPLANAQPLPPTPLQHLNTGQQLDHDSDSDSFQGDDPFGPNQFSSIEYQPGESGRATGRY